MCPLQVETMRERVRDLAPGATRRARKPWVPPDPYGFWHGTILAFDQTLTHTGWVVLNSGRKGLFILAGDCLSASGGGLISFSATYAKAEAMQRLIGGVVSDYAEAVDGIVYEMPATQGHRIESALIAGFLVHQAVAAFAPRVRLTAVSNQHMRAVMNPPKERDEKRYVRQAVEALIPKERRVTRRWNEHVHDAAALGLTYLYDEEMHP